MKLISSLLGHWILTLVVLCIIAGIVVLGVGLTKEPNILPSVLIGKPWPDKPLPQMGSTQSDGDPIGTAQLVGKPRLVNVWASWCVECTKEQPTLNDLGQTLKEHGQSDMLIGLNYKDTRVDATNWLQRWGNPFATILVDKDGRMGMELGVYGAPESYLIDEKGIIVWKQVGALTPEIIAKEVLPRLGIRS